MPLAEVRGRVAGLTQKTRQHGLDRRDVLKEGQVGFFATVDEVMKTEPVLNPAGDEAGPRRGANGCRGVKIGETASLLRQPIEVRRLDERVARNAEVATALVVIEENYDVRRPHRGLCCAQRTGQQSKEGEGN